MITRVGLQAEFDNEWHTYSQADGALEQATVESGEVYLHGELTVTPLTSYTDPEDKTMSFEMQC